MSKITPCLWFDDQGEAAATFYVETFTACGQPAALGERLYYGDAMHKPKGELLTIAFSLAGQDYVALNGGPNYTHSPALSLMVLCEDQDEIDAFWDGLLAGGGTPVACGWLTDRFGVSWQVAPKPFLAMLQDPDPVRVQRAMQAMMQMVKLDLPALRRAFEG